MPTRAEILTRLPRCLNESYNIYDDNTPADFAAVAADEISKYDEGQETSITSAEDLQAVRDFLAWCRLFEDKETKS